MPGSEQHEALCGGRGRGAGTHDEGARRRREAAAQVDRGGSAVVFRHSSEIPTLVREGSRETNVRRPVTSARRGIVGPNVPRTPLRCAFECKSASRTSLSSTCRDAGPGSLTSRVPYGDEERFFVSESPQRRGTPPHFTVSVFHRIHNHVTWPTRLAPRPVALLHQVPYANFPSCNHPHQRQNRIKLCQRHAARL